MKTANHHAYAPAANPRTRPIIFWGVWLYFGPSAVIAAWIVWDLFHDLLLEFDTDLAVLLILPLGYGLVSLWALWSVTKGYLTGSPRK